MIARSSSARAARQGMTLLEVVVAAGILTATTGVLASGVALAWRQQAALDARLAAQEIAQTVMDRVTAAPWEEIGPELATRWGLSEQARTAHPFRELRLSVEDVAGPPAGKKVTVEVQWSAAPNRPPGEVRLVSWVFRSGSDAP